MTLSELRSSLLRAGSWLIEAYVHNDDIVFFEFV
jgi:hypothetical protein